MQRIFRTPWICWFCCVPWICCFSCALHIPPLPLPNHRRLSRIGRSRSLRFKCGLADCSGSSWVPFLSDCSVVSPRLRLSSSFASSMRSYLLSPSRPPFTLSQRTSSSSTPPQQCSSRSCFSTSLSLGNSRPGRGTSSSDVDWNPGIGNGIELERYAVQSQPPTNQTEDPFVWFVPLSSHEFIASTAGRALGGGRRKVPHSPSDARCSHCERWHVGPSDVPGVAPLQALRRRRAHAPAASVCVLVDEHANHDTCDDTCAEQNRNEIRVTVNCKA
mmetsp:Transcript_66265/g.147900  ORF Transcript_66265/g.147900 Transcript_66265/m.147900 type:complete len:274 (+) Transcript_66265:108-929(+)